MIEYNNFTRFPTGQIYEGTSFVQLNTISGCLDKEQEEKWIHGWYPERRNTSIALTQYTLTNVALVLHYDNSSVVISLNIDSFCCNVEVV